jgi:hypothetical protein
MKLILNLKERLSLEHALSFMQGSYVKFVLAKDIQSKVVITPEEINKFHIIDLPDGSGITWDNRKDTNREFDLSDEQLELIVECLKAMDAQKRLVWAIIPFYEKIMDEHKAYLKRKAEKESGHVSD